MSLKITNKLTEKQRAILVKLEYYGTFDLTVEQATDLIEELFEQKSQDEEDRMYADYPDGMKFGD